MRYTMPTLKLLHDFSEAFNRHDLDGIMALMTDDCQFLLSVGPEPHGRRYVAKAAVRAGIGDGETCPPLRARSYPSARSDRSDGL
jgi:hypothetical protein